MDAAIVRTALVDPEGLVITPLLEEPMVVALPVGHALAQGDGGASLSLRRLASETFILYGPHVNGKKWRDIMSYKDSCGGCPRLPVWSSPTVFVDGEPAGTEELDNARVIAERAWRVAAFR
jgi:DNA-binding transcriptional LysR family regulator